MRLESSEKGFFLVLEGMDGSGTTTQRDRVVDALTEEFGKGTKVVGTEEPSIGPIGSMIRQILAGRTSLRKDDGRINTETLSLLFAADRLDHWEHEIKPVLQRGGIVVSDRYYYSSLAYQSEDHEDRKWIRVMNRYAPVPDLTVYLDVEPDTAIKRIAGRESKDHYEEDTKLAGIRDSYKTVLSELEDRGEPIERIDGQLERDAITELIVSMVQEGKR